MSDVSMMGSRVSAQTWQQPGDTPIVGGMIGRLLDLTAAGWVSTFASAAVSDRPSESDQGLVLGVGQSSLQHRGVGVAMASQEDGGLAMASQQGRGVGVIAVADQGTAGAASQLASLNPRNSALAEPKLQNVARALTQAEKQALDEYVSQGKPPEQRAQAAERIACFIGSNASALRLNDLDLTRLPDIVKTLRLDTLDVSRNNLAEVPLPAEVAFLYVSGNALTTMPILPEGTRMVFAADNRIREFRGPLPDTLSHVYAPNNMLDALPPFPAAMVQFDIEGNTGKLTQADVDAKICAPLLAQPTYIPV